MKSKCGEVEGGVVLSLVGVFFIILLIPFAMWGCPKYGIYRRTLGGEAQLREAEWNRQIAVKEAQAKQEAAKALAQAEVERARGVAEANRIIGESLAHNEAYLRYLWIQGLESNNPTVVYVPTEANLPILEAHRFGSAKAP